MDAIIHAVAIVTFHIAGCCHCRAHISYTHNDCVDWKVFFLDDIESNRMCALSLSHSHTFSLFHLVKHNFICPFLYEFLGVQKATIKKVK